MKNFALFLLGLLAVNTAFAVTAPEAGRVKFLSSKKWTAARWYIVGKFEKGTFEWLGSPVTPLSLEGGEKCQPLLGDGRLVRRKNAKGAAIDLEILQSGPWIAVELSPAVSSEEFEWQVKDGSSLDKCRAKLALSYQWSSAGKQDLRPLLFLAAGINQHYNMEIELEVPVEQARKATKADVQLDVLMGVWQSNFANVESGGNAKLLFIPTVVARAEWMPTAKHWGVSLALEQTLASLGGIVDQQALLADWSLGFFGEKYFLVLDALQLRASIKIGQYLADQIEDVPTVAEPNRLAQYAILGLGANLYFANRWFAGLDIEYGPKTSLAGRGAGQGFMLSTVGVGYRASPSLSILGEIAYRMYQADGYLNESLIQLQAGIRLEL